MHRCHVLPPTSFVVYSSITVIFHLLVGVLLFTQALEFVQDSKATIFLVLELARGGELFDRIKVKLVYSAIVL